MNARTMLTLPVAVQGGRCMLPLCDATAVELAAALIEASASAQSDKLAAVLAVDPALAVWGLFHAGSGAATIEAVAKSLAPRLLDLLSASSSAPATFSAEQHAQFAALVAESVAAASEIARALGNVSLNVQPEYLAALTGHWRRWIEVCGGQLDSIGVEWPTATPAASDSLSVESRAAGDAAWRRWLTEITGVHSLLPLLVARLRQSAELETDFVERLQAAKLDSLKEFAYGAGHELNNPLANIASRAQTLLREETHPDRRRRLAAINTQAFRAHEMLADMMLFARPPRLAPEAVNLVQLADEVLAELADDAAAQATSLHPSIRRDPLVLEADPVQLQVALRALCVNALESLGTGGNIRIEIGSSDEHLEISVADDGPGISADFREKIFDPFFSGREAGRGLGFGLSKAWRIVTLHGGQIIVDSQPGRGATFTIALPMQTQPSCQQSTTDESLRH